MDATTADRYRVPPSPFAPGKELNGNHVVQSPEDYLSDLLDAAVAERERATYLTAGGVPRKKTRTRVAEDYARVEAYSRALAVVQAGSSYFNGDERHKLVDDSLLRLKAVAP